MLPSHERPIHEIEDEMDASENAGRTSFAENVFSVCAVAMATILFVASCTGCWR